MDIRLIKNDNDYNEALHAFKSLMLANPEVGSPERNRMEVLGLLLEKYEDEHFDFGNVDPVAAIRLVMDQKNLRPVNLSPYFGSRARVSEVLAGKRGLTLAMIRKLHKELGIPAEVLIEDPSNNMPDDSDLVWTAFPFSELIQRGWFSEYERVSKELSLHAEELVRGTILTFLSYCKTPVLARQGTYHLRGEAAAPDLYALAAWQARVVEKALQFPAPKSHYDPDASLLRRVAELSILDDGPVQAIILLQKYGIRTVIEPNFKKTYLDGGAILLNDESPVIGLTLRHDRLDNFWFTLLHELAHVVYHLPGTGHTFFDDNDAADETGLEHAADEATQEALIPNDRWDPERAKTLAHSPNNRSLQTWAFELKVSPAVLAGRIRYEHKNFKIYSSIVGNGIPSSLLVQ